MNCTKCGKEIEDGENKVCEECRAKLVSEIQELVLFYCIQSSLKVFLLDVLLEFEEKRRIKC